MASTKKQWRIDYNTDAPPCRLAQEGLLLHLGLVVDFLGAERRQGATILGLALQCIALGRSLSEHLLGDDGALDLLLQLHIVEFSHCSFLFFCLATISDGTLFLHTIVNLTLI